MSGFVSVLIVNYLAYDELACCLESLSGVVATGQAETIVVDNASDSRRLAEIRQRFPDTRILPNAHNPGFAAGVNRAAAQARGDRLLLLNPDAVLVPGALEQMSTYLDNEQKTGVVGPRVYDPDGTLQRSARSFPDLWTGLFGRTSVLTRVWPGNPLSRRNLPGDEDATTAIDVDWVAGSCLMIRHDVFTRLGGMDERFFLYWEDADLCRRAHDLGWRCLYVPVRGAVHQVGRSSRRANVRSIVAFHRSAFYYEVKHRRGPARVIAVPAAALALAGRAALLIGSSWIRSATAGSD